MEGWHLTRSGALYSQWCEKLTYSSLKAEIIRLYFADGTNITHGSFMLTFYELEELPIILYLYSYHAW